MRIRNLIGTFAKNSKSLSEHSSTSLMHNVFSNPFKNKFILNRVYPINLSRSFYQTQWSFSAHLPKQTLAENVTLHSQANDPSQRAKELFSDLSNRKLTCAADEWTFDKRKSVVMNETIYLINRHVELNQFSEALEYEKFFHNISVSENIEDLQRAYHSSPGINQSIQKDVEFDLLINKKKTKQSIEKFERNSGRDYYTYHMDEVNEHINSYHTKISNVRKYFSLIIDELEKNDLWIDIKPNIESLYKLKNSLKDDLTEAKLAKLIHDTFHKNGKFYFKGWHSIKSEIEEYWKYPNISKYECNEFFTRNGKLLHALLDSEFVDKIHLVFPEENIELMCMVEKWDILYSLANDDEKISAQRYYSNKYNGKNGYSDDAIRQKMLEELKQASLLGQANYDMLISKKRETYNVFVLNPAYWYGPIPESIFQGMLIKLQKSLWSIAKPDLTEKDIKLIREFINSKLGKSLLRDKYFDLVDFTICPEDAKIDLIIISNTEMSNWQQYNSIFGNHLNLNEFSSMGKTNRTKYIKLLFSHNGIHALDENLFTLKDFFALTDDKYNTLMPLLNNDDRSISDESKLKIKQIIHSDKEPIHYFGRLWNPITNQLENNCSQQSFSKQLR